MSDSSSDNASTPRIPSLQGVASDKDRINVLFAPFRPRDANPESYDRKLRFWTKAVEEYGTICNRLSFSIKDLQKEFRMDGRNPACLDEVISNFCKNGVIVTEKDFLENLRAAESWKSWSQVSAWKVARKVGSYVPSPMSYFYRIPEGEVTFVNIERLKTISETVASEPSLLNKLISNSAWRHKVKDLTKQTEDKDLDYLFNYLKATKRIITDKIGSEDVLMMGSAVKQSKISDVEKGKYDIARTKEILEKQLNDITEKAQQAEDRARTSLKQGRRNTAKHELRRKKLLEQRMDKLLTMVDNLTVLGMQIEDAESDTVMISAYEAGKKALSGVLEDKRMNADKVTEAMLDIQELLDEHADISAALSQPMDNQSADISELEDELDKLMKEDEEKSEEPLKPIHIPQPTPSQPAIDNDAQEVEKLLKDLDLDDLDEFSKTLGGSTTPTSSQV